MRATTARAILADRELTEGARVALITLYTYADGEGVCWPSNSLLAGTMGVEMKTVKRRLSELAAKGRISTDYMRHQGKRTVAVDLKRYAAGVNSDPPPGVNSDPPPGVNSDPTRGQFCPEQGSILTPPGVNFDPPHLEQAIELAIEQATERNFGGVGGNLATVPGNSEPAPDPAEVARVAKLAESLNPYQNGAWAGHVHQFASMYSPAWILAACEKAAAAGKGDWRFVHGILRRYQQQGGPDAAPTGGRRSDGPPPGMKFSQVGQPPQRPYEPAPTPEFSVSKPGDKVGAW